MRIGITGGIGSGKSFVCSVLRKRGIEVYDCDDAAKRLMRNSKSLQDEISKVVGKDVFPEGILDKKALTLFLLESEENAKRIDSIVHPCVFRDYLDSGISWVESAILFECGMNKIVDITICVSAPLDIRIKRIMERDSISESKSRQWIAKQLPQEEKESLADHILYNDGERNIEEQIDIILKKLNNKNKTNN